MNYDSRASARRIAAALAAIEAKRTEAKGEAHASAAPAKHDAEPHEHYTPSRRDIKRAALAALKFLQFLAAAGERSVEVCYMRRARDRKSGERIGDCDGTFLVGGRSPAANENTTSIAEIGQITRAKLERWIRVGASRQTETAEKWDGEVELHMRLVGDIRHTILLEEVPATIVDKLRYSRLWRVVMETSPGNHLVLLRLPRAISSIELGAVQVALAVRLGCDPSSTVADKWHPFPGPTNNNKAKPVHGQPGIRGTAWPPLDGMPGARGAALVDGAPVPEDWLPTARE